MSILEQIPVLEALAKLDESILALETEIASKRGALDDVRRELDRAVTEISTTSVSIAAMEKTRNELHADARQLTGQLDRSREKLSRSRNERESMAAQRELEELRKLIRDREIEVEKLTGLIDRARGSLADSEGRRDARTADLDGSADGTSAEIAEREASRAALLAEREGVAKKLPNLLVRKYDGVRQRRPRAIAHTHDGVCAGCHIAVPPMMFQKMLRREEFEQCPNCRRILYYKPKPQDPAAD